MACRDKLAVKKTALSGVYEIRAQWDSEAGVWVTESEDVPGLLAEADSPYVLVRKPGILIPELSEFTPRAGRTSSARVVQSGHAATFLWTEKPNQAHRQCGSLAGCGTQTGNLKMDRYLVLRGTTRPA